ncbi:MAG: DUF523 domain-containing protein [Peptococcaceae bacterium]|nr:DUF523 domain-containing protein [Peptococcaceae bacterium]
MILVSACLLGQNVKYNGNNNYNQAVIDFLAGKDYLPICPESAGGLTIPRLPSEICGGTGVGVLGGTATVINQEGVPVTEAFLKGAKAIEALLEKYDVTMAILKENSPSCGVTAVYDGTFSKEKIPGMGVAAALLHSHGIPIYSEKNLPIQSFE